MQYTCTNVNFCMKHAASCFHKTSPYLCTINSHYLELIISIFLVTFYDDDMLSFLLRCSNIYGSYYMLIFYVYAMQRDECIL